MRDHVTHQPTDPKRGPDRVSGFVGSDQVAVICSNCGAQPGTDHPGTDCGTDRVSELLEPERVPDRVSGVFCSDRGAQPGTEFLEPERGPDRVSCIVSPDRDSCFVCPDPVSGVFCSDRGAQPGAELLTPDGGTDRISELLEPDGSTDRVPGLVSPDHVSCFVSPDSVTGVFCSDRGAQPSTEQLDSDRGASHQNRQHGHHRGRSGLDSGSRGGHCGRRLALAPPTTTPWRT